MSRPPGDERSLAQAYRYDKPGQMGANRLEVADLIRAAGQGFIERNRRWLTYQHLKVLTAIARCRTAADPGAKSNADLIL